MHNSQLLDKYRLSLPLSKSVRARELILDGLNGKCVDIESDNDDIYVLSRALRECVVCVEKGGVDGCCLLDLHHSGTALRFMTAYCAVSEGVFLLTGSARLCQRPIKPLVDALRSMGASIEYAEREGYAPLRILGRKLKGGRVKLDASLSSQFASALMLISDRVDGGVDIEYDGGVASRAYIDLTKEVINRYKSGIQKSEERDWSSAVVWYSVMAVMRRGRFVLKGLTLNSGQPDRAVVGVFEKLGVKTLMGEQGVEIECGGKVDKRLELDCSNMPDSVMYIVVAACLLGVEFEIKGVKTLRLKESDRIASIIDEMRKCGYVLEYDEMGKICWSGECCERDELPQIKTYDDHRVGMSMSIVGLKMRIEIENRDVVNKSYPEFWDEYKKVIS